MDNSEVSAYVRHLCPPKEMIGAAVLAARQSPCWKSKRGVVVFRQWDGLIVATANNRPPGAMQCTDDAPCRKTEMPLDDSNALNTVWHETPEEHPVPSLRPEYERGLHVLSNVLRDGAKQRCARYAVHAEQDAIRKTIARMGRETLNGFSLVHVKITGPDGNPVPGGGPSCWQCARDVLEVGLSVYLYEAQADPMWVLYSAEAFYRETLAACGFKFGKEG